MLELTLNIGLSQSMCVGGYKVPHVTPSRTIVDILDEPYRIALVLERVKTMALCGEVEYCVAQSYTEATLICKYRAVDQEAIGDVFALSEALHQDCIAVWVHNNVNGGCGQLIGRYNYVYGAFDESKFMYLSESNV